MAVKCSLGNVNGWFTAVLAAILVAIATAFNGPVGWAVSAVSAAIAFGLTYALNNAFKKYKQCRDQHDGTTQKCLNFADNFNKLLGALRTTLGIAVAAFIAAAFFGPLGGPYAFNGQIALFFSLVLLFTMAFEINSYRKCRDQQASL